MMTYDAYIGYSYGIPFAFFAFLLIYLGIFSNYRTAYFIVDTVLGIRRIPEKVSNIPSSSSTTNQQQSEVTNNMKTTCCTRSMSKFLCCRRPFINCRADHLEDVSIYLHIEHDKTITFDRTLRRNSYLITCGILTILLMFIYESCVLFNVTIKIGDWCPDYEAECFDVNSSMLVFNCTPYQKITFNTNSSYVRCFGWVYDQMTIRKVIDATGVCGGSLGIISCIVPWTYHLSYNENQPCIAFCWIWIPFLSFVALIVIVAVGEAGPWAPPSMLTFCSLLILGLLTLYALHFAYNSAKTRNQSVSPKTDAGQSTTPTTAIIQITA